MSNNKIGPNEKVVLKSTTNISLHDRFTALKDLAAALPKIKKASKPAPPPPEHQPYPRARRDHPCPDRRRSSSPENRRQTFYGDYDFRHELFAPIGRNRTLAEQIAGGSYFPPSRRPPSLKFQSRSIQNRLGSRFSYNYRDNWNHGRIMERGFTTWRPRFRFGQDGYHGRGFRRSRSLQVIVEPEPIPINNVFGVMKFKAIRVVASHDLFWPLIELKTTT